MIATVIASLVLAVGRGSVSELRPDLPVVLERARTVQQADMAAWRHFGFRHLVRYEKLDAAGQVAASEELDFRVTPTPGGWDEELVSLDGRKPTAREVAQHRRLAPFSRTYTAFQQGEGRKGGRGVDPLGLLLLRASYADTGPETVDGLTCHRLEFGPAPGEEAHDLLGRITREMSGSLWLTSEDHHILRARMRAERPVSLVVLLAKVSELEIDLDCRLVSADVWLPRRVVMRTTIKLPWGKRVTRTTYEYSGFVPVRSGVGSAPTEQVTRVEAPPPSGIITPTPVTGTPSRPARALHVERGCLRRWRRARSLPRATSPS
jgi:hypothetical protein